MTRPARTARSLAARHPAETTGGIAGAVTITAAALGAHTTLVAVLGAWAGLAPAAITGLRKARGVRGLLDLIWTGR